jgi:hypothetical protein
VREIRTIRRFGRDLPPVPSISVPFLMTRISSGEELMVVSQDPFATYYPWLPTLSFDNMIPPEWRFLISIQTEKFLY